MSGHLGKAAVGLQREPARWARTGPSMHCYLLEIKHFARHNGSWNSLGCVRGFGEKSVFTHKIVIKQDEDEVITCQIYGSSPGYRVTG